jgi:sugar/nucleoside kinase (ribokinase family)
MTTRRTGPGVLCVGRLYCDLIFTEVPRLPSLGTEVFAGGLGLHAGGGAYITAAYLASLGHHAALASFLPAAPFGDIVAAEIAAAGVDLSPSLRAAPELDPQITVSMVMGGERGFLTRRSGPALPQISPADLGRLRARHLHVGELTTLVERPSLLGLAREAGLTVSLDCGWDETLTAAKIGDLLARVDVFLPNAAEAQHLRMLGLAEPLAPLTVVKRGAEGASAVQDGCEFREAAGNAVAVDTTGAGDAFNAGFLSAWLAGEPVGACLRAGNALGAQAIRSRGGFQAAGSR